MYATAIIVHRRNDRTSIIFQKRPAKTSLYDERQSRQKFSRYNFISRLQQTVTSVFSIHQNANRRLDRKKHRRVVSVLHEQRVSSHPPPVQDAIIGHTSRRSSYRSYLQRHLLKNFFITIPFRIEFVKNSTVSQVFAAIRFVKDSSLRLLFNSFVYDV